MMRLPFALIVCLLISPRLMSTYQFITDAPTIPYQTIGRGYISTLGWTFDNQYLVVITANDVWFYDRTFNLIDRLHNVRFASLDPTGYTVAAVTEDGTVRLWDAHTRVILGDLPIGQTIRSMIRLQWNADGSILAVPAACDGGCFSVWETETRTLVYESDLDILYVSLNPGETRLAIQGRERLKSWVLDLQPPFALRSIDARPHTDGYSNFFWQDDDTLIHATADGGPSYDTFIVDVTTGESMQQDFTQEVRIAQSAAGYIQIGTMGGDEFILKGADTYHLTTGPWVGASAWSHSGTRLAAGGYSPFARVRVSVELYDVEREITEWSAGDFTQVVRHIAWSHDDRLLLLSDDAHMLTIIDALSGQHLAETHEHSQVGDFAEWRPDHDQLAIADARSGWGLYDVSEDTWIEQHHASPILDRIGEFAWSASGRFVLAEANVTYSLSPPTGATAYVFDLDDPSDAPLPQINDLESDVYSYGSSPYFVWHPAEDVLLQFVADDQESRIIVWSIAEQRAVRVVPYRGNTGFYIARAIDMGISPSGRFLHLALSYIDGRRSHHILSVETGSEVDFREGANFDARGQGLEIDQPDLDWAMQVTGLMPPVPTPSMLAGSESTSTGASTPDLSITAMLSKPAHIQQIDALTPSQDGGTIFMMREGYLYLWDLR